MARAEAVAEIEYLPPDRVVQQPVYYSESDGEPMAETDIHANVLIYLREALKDYYRDDPQVYVAGNLFLYYEEGQPHSRVAPDVFVVFGVPKEERRVYKVWEESKGPDIVIEISSRSTRREDLWEKRGLYEFLGVGEYILFDPLHEYLTPPLQSYGLVEGWYRPMEPEQDEQGEWRFTSRQLELELRTEGNSLRLYDPKTGEKLLTPLEAQEKARRATAHWRQEAERRRQAEAEAERLRAELARLRAGRD